MTSSSRRTALVLVGLYAALAVPGILRSHFWGDEGWYACAARSVMEGQKPYRDFAFFQMPLAAYVYAAWFCVVGPSVEAARALSVLLGAAGLALAVAAAGRLAGAAAAAVAGLLLALNGSYLAHTIAFKTQPLTVALVSGTTLAVAACGPQAGFARLFAAAALGWLCVLARLSMLPVALAVLPVLLWARRDRPALPAAAFAASTALFAAALVWFNEGGRMWFDVYGSHQLMAGGEEWTPGRFHYFWKTFVLEQFPLVALLACASLALTARLRTGEEPRDQSLVALASLLAAYAGCFAIHGLNRHSYAVHQVSTMSLAAVLAGAIAARLIGRASGPRGWPAAGSCAAPAGAPTPADAAPPPALRQVSSGWPAAGSCAARAGAPTPADAAPPPALRQVSSGWLVPAVALTAFLHLTTVGLRFGGTIDRLREAAALIETHSAPGDAVLSFNAELAVESGRRALPGYAMSEFGYFPGMSDGDVQRYHLVNSAKLVADIRARTAAILCAGDREFALMAAGDRALAGRIQAAIDECYVPVGKVEKYGQFQQTLSVFRARRS